MYVCMYVCVYIHTHMKCLGHPSFLPDPELIAYGVKVEGTASYASSGPRKNQL